MIELHRRLREHGVLGINRRNADYLLLHNPRHLYPRVDDKLLTKKLALEAGMAVPALYGVIEAQHDLAELPRMFADHQQFVLKPAHGSGGNGIVVITDRRDGRYVTSNGKVVDLEEIEQHLSNTVSGLYSLGNHRDKALIEYCVRFDPLFEDVAYQGVPDIRIIVFRGYPVMAMVRLPTQTSQGRANLHQGAIGAGVDLASGVTLDGVSGEQVIRLHPDTGNPISGLTLPDWQGMLELAARSWEITGLGYIGVDLVLDRDLGPLVLELNARPGLAIQIANRRGLLARLEKIEADQVDGAPVTDRVAFSRVSFAH